MASPKVRLQYHSLRNVTSPEDADAGRRRYCGTARGADVLQFDVSDNIRSHLGTGDDGKKRKRTLVNLSIRDTLRERPEMFPLT